MTATAQAAAEEFQEFYDLTVAVIPPNRPCVRVDHSDLVFATKEAKLRALVSEITEEKELTDEIEKGLEDALNEFNASWN